MSYQNGPKIVTDGLVLCLDAGNSKSYPGSGTTWTDLSRNSNNGTLTNGPTFNSTNGGNIVFDGVDDYVSTTRTSTTSFTWVAWFRTNVVSSGFKNILSVRTPSYMLMLMDDDTSNMGFWASDTLTTGPSLNMTGISVNVWYHATFVREGNSITNGYKTYLNGSFRGSANTGTWSSSDPIIIGGRTDATQFFNGNIAAIQIYNRALSAAEILQNYNATKGRYKL
jgi:hypothetical protein